MCCALYAFVPVQVQHLSNTGSDQVPKQCSTRPEINETNFTCALAHLQAAGADKEDEGEDEDDDEEDEGDQRPAERARASRGSGRRRGVGGRAWPEGSAAAQARPCMLSRVLGFGTAAAPVLQSGCCM